MSSQSWIIVPTTNLWDYLKPALEDMLAQTVTPKVLVINNASTSEIRQKLEEWAEREPRLLLWNHEPPLMSLSAQWNAALDMVWAAGGEEALVANNDLKMSPQTYEVLRTVLVRTGALFVSAVGVTPDQYNPTVVTGDLLMGAGIEWDSTPFEITSVERIKKGGPDFSCFLISRQCHQQFRFDEAIIPLFAEDLDFHRRLMLAGLGEKIFSVNLPYLHFASRTLKGMDPVARAQLEQRITLGARAYYARKWGPVNQETFLTPFGYMEGEILLPGGAAWTPPDACGHVTTPELQAHHCDGRGHGCTS